MKTIKIILMVIIMSMVIRADEIDKSILIKMLHAISVVESNCCDYPNEGKALHKDSQSYGRYGVTEMALKELQREHRVPESWTEEDLSKPNINYKVAKEYLKLMFERTHSWYKAVGWYHGGDEERRENYSLKIFKLF